MQRWRRLVVFVVMSALLILVGNGASSEVVGADSARRLTLPSFFSSNMVIQRDRRIHVWGGASSGETITVEFAGQSAVTVAQGGQWEVWLDPLPAGGPYELMVTGEKEKRSFHNVLVGDVWIASGQSNMVTTVQTVTSGADDLGHTQLQEARRLASSRIRLFQPTVVDSAEPLQDYVSGGWRIGSFEAATSFSAVGFFFAGYLQQSLDVPIGIMQLAKGATAAQTWMSDDAFQTSETLRQVQELTEQFETDRSNKPGALYNGMIAPLHKFPIRGVIWYQGERNANQYSSVDYSMLMQALINDWRQKWHDDLPFLVAQLPGFARNAQTWPDLREAQRQVALTTDNVGLVVTIDLGERTNIHPRNKAPVGYRLALQARCVAYGEDTLCSGPTVDRAERQGNRVILTFEHVGGGLVPQGKHLSGFRLCDKGGEWMPAEAVVEGQQVIVWSVDVGQPIAVSYAWSDYPDAGLFNAEGLPAGPFLAAVEAGYPLGHFGLVSPAAAAVVAGEIPLELEGVPEVLKRVDVTIAPFSYDLGSAGKSLYSGSTLPAGFKFDTTTLDDGVYYAVANISLVDGRTMEIRHRITVRNWRVMEDEVLAPLKGGWFGEVDRMRTVEATAGWEFTGDQSDVLFGDADRIRRQESTTESLTWEMSGLHDFAFTVYTRDPASMAAIRVDVSADGETWTPASLSTGSLEEAETGWWRIVIVGQTPPGVDARYNRFTMEGIGASPHDLQLGHVVLRGLSELRDR